MARSARVDGETRILRLAAFWVRTSNRPLRAVRQIHFPWASPGASAHWFRCSPPGSREMTEGLLSPLDHREWPQSGDALGDPRGLHHFDYFGDVLVRFRHFLGDAASAMRPDGYTQSLQFTR